LPIRRTRTGKPILNPPPAGGYTPGMRIALAIAAFLLALPLLCGALFFWVTVGWNIYLQGLSFLSILGALWMAGGVVATVVSLLFVWLGIAILHGKGERPRPPGPPPAG
jgi:membrane protein implicated in regulation of membrane protease activity